jgi:hypothetical protein
VIVERHLAVVLDACPSRRSRRSFGIVIPYDEVLSSVHYRKELIAVPASGRHEISKMPDVVVRTHDFVPVLYQSDVVRGEVGKWASVDPKDACVCKVRVAGEVDHPTKMARCARLKSRCPRLTETPRHFAAAWFSICMDAQRQFVFGYISR